MIGQAPTRRQIADTIKGLASNYPACDAGLVVAVARAINPGVSSTQNYHVAAGDDVVTVHCLPNQKRILQVVCQKAGLSTEIADQHPNTIKIQLPER